MAMSKEEIAAKAQAAGLALSPEQLEMAHQAVLSAEVKRSAPLLARPASTDAQDWKPYDPATEPAPPDTSRTSPSMRESLNALLARAKGLVHTSPARQEWNETPTQRHANNAMALPQVLGMAGGMGGLLYAGPRGAGAGGALGDLAGQHINRALDYKPGVPQPDIDIGGALKSGAMQYGMAKVPPMASKYLLDRAAKLVNPLSEQVANIRGGDAQAQFRASPSALPPTELSGLSPEGFEKFRALAHRSDAPILTPPVGRMAELGGRESIGELAGRRTIGKQSLDQMAKSGKEMADIGVAGERGAKMASAAQAEMEGPLTEKLIEARPRLLDATRTALQTETPIAASVSGPRPTSPTPPNRSLPGNAPASVPTEASVIRPRGEKLVNKAFNEPNAFNQLLEGTPAAADFWRARGPMVTAGHDVGVQSGLKTAGMTDAARAQAAGATGAAAPALASDAAIYDALAKTLGTQRAGAGQMPAGAKKISLGIKAIDLPIDAAEWLGKKALGSRSTVGGFRPETPEQSYSQITPRLAELEAARRGLPVVDLGAGTAPVAAARQAAVEGLPRAGIANMTPVKPALQFASSPAKSLAAGDAITTFNLLRKAFADPEGP